MNPEIAVVVPTRNREARLAFLLDALAEQTLPVERFEVVVVRGDDQGPPFTSAPDGLGVRFLIAPGSSGPTDKRNIGWRASSAKLVAFTDDDCRPQPDWLQRLLDAADETSFLQGRTEPDPDETHLLRGQARTQQVTGPTPWFLGCNIAYPRALLERLGGFDESYSFGGEDTDIGLRAQALGAEYRYLDDAVVRHAVFSRSVIGAAREAVAWPSFPLVIKRHPTQRRHLFLGVFRNGSHAAICLGIAGALALRRRPALAAAAFLPYALMHTAGVLGPGRRTPRAAMRLAMHLPARAAVDAIEVGATVVGAASHRVLVL